jgi:hypothetical protein
MARPALVSFKGLFTDKLSRSPRDGFSPMPNFLRRKTPFSPWLPWPFLGLPGGRQAGKPIGFFGRRLFLASSVLTNIFFLCLAFSRNKEKLE